MAKLYLIGSLRNPAIPGIGREIREQTHWEVFDDWFAGGYEADDKWKQYEEERGRTYGDAIDGENARHIFEFDKSHLDSSDAACLVAPAGRSAHLELGYMVGKASTYVLFPSMPDERWDVMYRFADYRFYCLEALIEELSKHGLEPE